MGDLSATVDVLFVPFPLRPDLLEFSAFLRLGFYERAGALDDSSIAKFADAQISLTSLPLFWRTDRTSPHRSSTDWIKSRLNGSHGQKRLEFVLASLCYSEHPTRRMLASRRLYFLEDRLPRLDLHSRRKWAGIKSEGGGSQGSPIISTKQVSPGRSLKARDA